MDESEKTKEERSAVPQLQPLQIHRILAPTDLTELSTSAAEEMSADLLVVSTHHHSVLEYLFQVSDAEKIVRHAPCPVLVLHKGT